jgi:hypothetical protein
MSDVIERDGQAVWQITMTRQELFDAVCAHLAQQGRRSWGVSERFDDAEGCLYRGPDGLRCAVGALMPDAVYRPQWENATPGALRDTGVIEATDDAMALLKGLQQANDSHYTDGDDETPVEGLRRRLRAAAQRHGLDAGAVELITTWSH